MGLRHDARTETHGPSMPDPHRTLKATGERPSPRRRLATLGALLAGALLAGCSGSGPAPSASNPAATERSQEQKAETKFEDFARCLREHGVDAEALNRPGGGHGLKISPGSAGAGAAAMEAAEKACARFKPEDQRGTPSPQQKVELEEAAQKFARCMREHGIEVEASGAGKILIHAKPGGGGPNPESPAFKAAQSACHKLLPGGGP